MSPLVIVVPEMYKHKNTKNRLRKTVFFICAYACETIVINQKEVIYLRVGMALVELEEGDLLGTRGKKQTEECRHMFLYLQVLQPLSLKQTQRGFYKL